MTTISVPADLVPRIYEHSPAAGLRLPTDNIGSPGAASRDLVYDPDLSVAEQASFDLILALARSGMAHLSPTEYETVRPQLQALRDFRQLGRNAFMALPSDAERFRRLYDAQTQTTIILLAILRD